MKSAYYSVRGEGSAHLQNKHAGLSKHWRKELAKIPARRSQRTSSTSSRISTTSSAFDQEEGVFDQDETEDAIMAAQKAKSRVAIHYRDGPSDVRLRGRQNQVRAKLAID